jgi:hypothetical protein
MNQKAIAFASGFMGFDPNLPFRVSPNSVAGFKGGDRDCGERAFANAG